MQNWIPCSEMLPPVTGGYEEYLIAVKPKDRRNGERCDIRIGTYETRDEYPYWDFDICNKDMYVAYWMPLPPDPCLETSGEWRSANTEPPNESGEYLILSVFGGVRRARYRALPKDNGKSYWVSSSIKHPFSVEHPIAWMPLPKEREG